MYDDLPLLPGKVGPAVPTIEYPEVPGASPTIVIQHQSTVSTETVTFPRILFPATVVEEEPEVGSLTSIELAVPTDPFVGWTKAQLYTRAKELKIPGRSRMTKAMLQRALLERYYLA